MDWNFGLNFSTNSSYVSLFTREWIEISSGQSHPGILHVSLFTREWIEIPAPSRCLIFAVCLPLYEGVDWNLRGLGLLCKCLQVSLFTREWIEISTFPKKSNFRRVSLFTREWIEIIFDSAKINRANCLPLYEGVDWNCQPRFTCQNGITSPSLRGSGLKCNLHPDKKGGRNVSLFTREWIEIPP